MFPQDGVPYCPDAEPRKQVEIIDTLRMSAAFELIGKRVAGAIYRALGPTPKFQAAYRHSPVSNGVTNTFTRHEFQARE
jgi:hypothetical protein